MPDETDEMERELEHPGGGHEAVWVLLPWSANETLTTAEREMVDRHLAGCAACRAELARCRELAEAVRAADVSAPTPHPVQLARLLARLDRLETTEAAGETDALDAIGAIGERAANPANGGGAGSGRPAADSAGGAGAAGRAAGRLRPAALLAATPRPVRYALFAQLAALLLLALAIPLAPRLQTGAAGGAGFLPAAGHRPEAGAAAHRAEYHTLAASPTADGGAAAAGSRVQIHIVFAESTTEKQIRELLLRARARLVDGPSPLGTYTLELPVASAAPPSPPARTTEGPPDSLGIVLTYLRSRPQVRFAEPVAGSQVAGAP